MLVKAAGAFWLHHDSFVGFDRIYIDDLCIVFGEPQYAANGEQK